jgi:serine/threonine-protein kinase HipA
MDKEVLVSADLEGVPHLVGRLWARVRKNRETATFEYDAAWLHNAARFSLEPALKLGPGPFHTPADTAQFGAIGVSSSSTRCVNTAPLRAKTFRRSGGGWSSTS